MIPGLIFFINILATFMLYLSVWWELAQFIFLFKLIQIKLQSHIYGSVYTLWLGERRIVLTSVFCSPFYGQHTGFITVIAVFYFFLVFHLLFLFMQTVGNKLFCLSFSWWFFPVYLWWEAAMLLLASNSQILMRYLRSPNGEPVICRENIE